MQRRQVLEAGDGRPLLGVPAVDQLDLHQGEVVLILDRQADRPLDDEPGAQAHAPNLRRRNIDVVGPRQIVVLRRTEKAESIGEGFQDTLRKDKTTLLSLCGQHFEDEFLLSHAGCAGDVHALRN